MLTNRLAAGRGKDQQGAIRKSRIIMWMNGSLLLKGLAGLSVR